VPVPRPDQRDRELPHLVGLDQRQRLEELVQGAEAAGEEDEPLRRLHQHHLARVEVAEGDGEVDVRVRILLVRELDVEADGEAAGLLGAAVGRLHHARPAAGDDGEARLSQEPPALARLLVVVVPGRDPRRAEHGRGRPRDPVDGLEAAQQLLRDQLDVRRVVVGLVLEDAAVDGHRLRGGAAGRGRRPSRSRAARRGRPRRRSRRSPCPAFRPGASSGSRASPSRRRGSRSGAG
jgi:hypothetical protein